MFQLAVKDTIELLRLHWLRLLLISAALGLATFVIFMVGFAVMMAGSGAATSTAGITWTTRASAGGTPVAAATAALQGMLIGLMVMMLLVSVLWHTGLAMMIRTCTEQEPLMDSFRAAVRQIPYHSSQAGIVAVPFLLPLVMTLLTGSPALGILFALLAVPYCFVAAPLYLLLSVECALGGREWVPRRAWELMRSNFGSSILIGVVLYFAILAISVVGSVLVFLAIFTAPASTMLLVAGAVALHNALDGGHRRHTQHTASHHRTPHTASHHRGTPTGNHLPAASGVPAAGATASAAATASAGGLPSHPAYHASAPALPGLLSYLPHGLQPSQSFSGMLQPAMSAAEWVGMSVDGVLVLRLTASSGARPSLQLVSQTGVPVPLSDMYPDDCVYAQVSAGWYQAGVGSTSMDHTEWALNAYQIPLETWNQAMSNASAAAGGFQRPA